ncbi:heme peroxidase family protein,putative calcium-binding protein [Xenococcus sp. PCC 7305]|uniref:peroxidase family protein n=1 Tax=Xenococcus sp. PCC 7305 TaxID=102125 RepID=UPI0002ACCC5D|nr:peroxidase family protein [Xenococcus sp. PCC 7305]ELS02752.1 heme peroxidase family protein,putative calcium-binding protein [Xenococcus sp. PCC 7305]
MTTNILIFNDIYQDKDPKFRSFDGTNNNFNQTNYGATNTALVNKSPLDYGDGFSTASGLERPNPRNISNAIAQQQQDIESKAGLTNTIWAFGQFLDHDLTLVADSAVSANIEVPNGDPFLDPLNTGTVEILMHESSFIEGTGTNPDNPRQLANHITSWIDGSNIYGSDETRANFLRSQKGGKLKVSAGELLPFNDGTQANDDPRGGDPTRLFVGGDVRANENSVLASIHTVFVREHNRIATELQNAHVNWSDEQIYQRARELNIAQYQAIIYNEYLPALLGEDALPDYIGYDATIDPSIDRVFANAAFRFGHTQLSSDILRLDPQGEEIAQGNLKLADVFFRSASVVQESGIAPILRGVSSSLSQKIDPKTIDDVRNLLFGFGENVAGRDLFAININRGRINGLTDYNSLREAYGLIKVTSFDAITSDPQLQTQLASLYGTVDNIDGFVGLLAEDHLAGAVVGETLKAVLVEQFVALRDGDRFFYQNSFSPQEISLIEQTTFADIIRRNTDTSIIQDNAFSLVNQGTIKSELLNGGLGSDTIYGHGGNDFIQGYADNDLLFGNIGADQLLGGNGDDTLFGGNDRDILRGQQGNDLLLGNANADNLFGGLGDDVLQGGDGDDLLQGNFGNDKLIGNAGADRLFGGNDSDTLNGGHDNDLLRGQNGNDLLFGNFGADNLFGDNGFDTLNGGYGNDQLRGNSGNDLLKGQADQDLLHGDHGFDTLFGNNGDDTLFGGSGNDQLSGDRNNDLLDGGLGFDVLIGGNGSDFFVLRENNGTDAIQDYQDGIDRFMLVDGLTFPDLKFTSGQNASQIRVEDTNQLLATVIGIEINILDSSDFIVS